MLSRKAAAYVSSASRWVTFVNTLQWKSKSRRCKSVTHSTGSNLRLLTRREGSGWQPIQTTRVLTSESLTRSLSDSHITFPDLPGHVRVCERKRYIIHHFLRRERERNRLALLITAAAVIISNKVFIRKRHLICWLSKVVKSCSKVCVCSFRAQLHTHTLLDYRLLSS